jgi:ankyrin repeat protein
MLQPDELKSEEPLLWSTGRGIDVWQMFQAAIAGDLPTIQRLLAADPNLIRGAFHYRKPMYFAVRENQLEVAQYLLDHGADPVNAWGPDTLPEIARDRGHIEMLHLLETSMSSKFHIDPDVEPISQAIRALDTEKALSFIDARPDLLKACDATGNYPFHWAVMTRNLELIDSLLQRGADINVQRHDGAGPLQLVNGDYTYRGWRDVPKEVTATPLDVAKLLLQRGVYVDMSCAAAMGNLQRVTELADLEPSLVNRSAKYVTYYIGSGTPLHNAASRGHMEIVKFLLSRGADPNLREEGIAPFGRALYSAVSDGHIEIAKLLLEHGANPNQPVESSADALHIAILHKNQPMIDLLCSYGASSPLHILAYYGDTKTAAAIFATNPKLADNTEAIENAASEGQEGFVRLMLKYQPDLATRMFGGAKTKELTEFLFSKGLNPNQRDWMMVTPLHKFAGSGNLEMATLFLDHGADIHAVDEELSTTPLGWAVKRGKKEMAELLLSRGAGS